MHQASRTLALSCALAGCAGAVAPPAHVASAAVPFDTTTAVEVPKMDIPLALARRVVVARGLHNPRGMLALPDGSLLLSEAGRAPDDPQSGTLSRLVDGNGDGDFLDDGEQRALLDHQPSQDLLERVHRDEVLGMAGIAHGGDTVLAALAVVGGTSTLFSVDRDKVSVWGQTPSDVEDLAYEPHSRQWYAVASARDEVLRLQPGGAAERVLELPLLPDGQHAAPSHLAYDLLNGQMLVSLFAGSQAREASDHDLELVPRGGAIISVDLAAKRFSWTVRGLTAPTDFVIASEASIYVLELCDAFVDPVTTRAALLAGPSHGGVRRYSGRLLRVDRMHRRVTLIAAELDTPTELAMGHVGFGEQRQTVLYVAEGMGMPDRAIPGVDGVVPLTGFIERLPLEAADDTRDDWL